MHKPPKDAPLTDERCQQIVALTSSLDASLSEQKDALAQQAQTIADQATTIANQAGQIEAMEEEIERLTEIIESGGGEPQPPEVRKPDIWFLPQATGDGSGSSPENAKAYSALPSVVGSCGPDKVLGLIGDKGDWNGVQGHTLSKGGAEGGPILIRGTDTAGAPFKTVLKSSREQPLDFTDPKYRGTDPSLDNAKIPIEEWSQGTRSGGTTLFTCNRGADWLSFSHLFGKDLTAFAFYGGDLIGHSYSDIDLRNVKHGWWMDDDPASGSSVERCVQQMLWERFNVELFEEDCFRWRGTSHHLVARDFKVRSGRVMGHITFGWTIGTGDDARNDVVTDWEIARGEISECHDTDYEKPWCSKIEGGKPSGETYFPDVGKIRSTCWSGENPGKKYWNGDGLSIERNCGRGLIEDLKIWGCTDAAIDCKAGDVIMRRVHAFDNKRNFRLYSPGLRMEQCISENAKKRGGSGGTAHIYLKGASATGGVGPELTLDRCTFRGAPSNAFSTEADYTYGIIVDGEETCTYEGCTGNPPAYKP